MSSDYAKPEHYFGGCPECGDTNGYLNVGNQHWFACETHKTKWLVGYNLFSSWQNESADEWQHNAAVLAGMREVEPLPPAPPTSSDTKKDYVPF